MGRGGGGGGRGCSVSGEGGGGDRDERGGEEEKKKRKGSRKATEGGRALCFEGGFSAVTPVSAARSTCHVGGRLVTSNHFCLPPSLPVCLHCPAARATSHSRVHWSRICTFRPSASFVLEASNGGASITLSIKYQPNKTKKKRPRSGRKSIS